MFGRLYEEHDPVGAHDRGRPTHGEGNGGARHPVLAVQGDAVIEGRDFCIPDDFKSLAIPALSAFT